MKNINKFITIGTFATLLTFSGCSATAKHSDKLKTTSQEHTSHWGYTGHNDPSHWGNISPKYRECSQGKNQSPINITAQDSVHANLKSIGFTYNTNSNSVINNGHTVQVNIDQGSNISIDNKSFELKQFHFHTPSENEIGGKHFPLEAHFVHVDKNGDISVVAVMFKEGATNQALENIWKNLPLKEGEKIALSLSSQQINAILPADKSYYRFSGSLTTPPCTEGVRWFLLKKPVSISKEQVEKFLNTMNHPNNRPIQNINAREVLY